MEPVGEIESPRFLWVAALTIAVSVMAVLTVRAAALRICTPVLPLDHSRLDRLLLTRYFV